MEQEYKFILEERLINFAVSIVELVKILPNDRVGNHLGNQMLRSGTSPGLNYGEALGSESKKDFAHKLGIVLKELRETLNCLKILNRTGYFKNETIIRECNELISIFVKTLKTTRSRM
jgi:four helix bundle protein